MFGKKAETGVDRWKKQEQIHTHTKKGLVNIDSSNRWLDKKEDMGPGM